MAALFDINHRQYHKKNIKTDDFFETNKAKKPRIKNKSSKIIVFMCLSIVIISIGFILCTNENIQKIFQLANIFKKGRHLVLFQNNAEIRPTGGFLGSFVVFDTKFFKPANIYFDTNIYKRDNNFSYNTKFQIFDSALAELLPEGNLTMRDSNWSVDFPQAAKNIAWFYKQEDGENVNTVVVINSEFFKNLLAIIGPVNMVKYDLEVDSKNFNEVIQKQVENDYYQDENNYGIHQPKSILAEMMPIAIARIKNPKNWAAIFHLIFKSLNRKDIMIFSFNEKLQNEILQNNWGGAVLKSTSDYLYINHANLGADKTSIYINEEIKYSVQKNPETNNLVAELELIKTIPEEKLEAGNRIFTRILTPNNSQLINAEFNKNNITQDVESTQEFGYNVFRIWDNIENFNGTVLKLKYSLPNNINLDNYSLLVQKQSGAINQDINIYLNAKNIYKKEFNTDIYINYKSKQFTTD